LLGGQLLAAAACLGEERGEFTNQKETQKKMCQGVSMLSVACFNSSFLFSLLYGTAATPRIYSYLHSTYC
jgi:hypothetical protein